MQKLLSVAIPCYNSQDYVRKAIESVLPGKDRVEIIVVDDGSTDDTAKIGDEYAAKYPGIVKVVRKENGGHGDAVMTGVANATGLYFRVLDSDDWLDKDSLEKVLAVLDKMDKENDPVDLLITNYVYEKVNEGRRKQIHYRKNLPVNRKFTWDEVGYRFIYPDALCYIPHGTRPRVQYGSPEAHFLCRSPLCLPPHDEGEDHVLYRC